VSQLIHFVDPVEYIAIHVSSPFFFRLHRNPHLRPPSPSRLPFQAPIPNPVPHKSRAATDLLSRTKLRPMSTCVIGQEDTTPYHAMSRRRATELPSGCASITLSTANTSAPSVIPKPRRQLREAKSRSPPKNAPPSHAESSDAKSAAQDPRRQISLQDFEKIFNSTYHDFFYFNKFSASAEQAISSQDVDVEEFDRLTIQKQYQRYIALSEGPIIFHEVPNAPHGEVISRLHDIVARQLDLSVFAGSSDNGMIPPIPLV